MGNPGPLVTYTRPAPDAQGNPPCDGFLTDDIMAGADWNGYYEGADQPQGVRVPIQKRGLQLPDDFRIVLQTKDGKHHTKEAVVAPGASGPWDGEAEYDFLFPDIDPADVKEVLLTNRKGTCWLQGPADVNR